MRITAVCAALGAAVGTLLALVLRFFAGQSVLDGLAERGGSPIDLVRVLPVASGSGLVAGLLVGVVVRVAAARRVSGVGHRVLAGALVLCGVVVGVGVATELHAYGQSAFPSGDFGWYAYSPLSNSVGTDGVFYGRGPAASSWPLVLSGVVVGLAVGVLAALAVARRRVLRASTSPSG